MEQVSPEVKEAYLNNLTYTTINKKDWKALNRVYNVDNASHKQDIFDRTMFILSGLTVVMTIIIAFIINSPVVLGFLLLSLVPLPLAAIEDNFNIIYNSVKKKDRFLRKYRKANDTFSILIEGDDKNRYYSRWYLELINPKVKSINLVGDCKYVEFNSISTEKIVSRYHDTYTFKEYPVTRHPDRFNWRNTLSTNRVLSIKEYKKLIKSKEEYKEYLKMEEDIREFQEYNGL